MATRLLAGLVVASILGCGERPPASPPRPTETLKQARAGFQTALVRQEREKDPPPAPPANLFTSVVYPAPAGKTHAYLSRHPSDGRKRPAIIWITGGDCNSIGETAWEPAPVENDQSARAFRQEGVVMMFPSLRGGSGSPGVKEGFFGEVEDILAAADYLAQQPNVDASRIYLGGHSTGGTLALLVAAYEDRFRAVFSFGPVADVSGYGANYQPYKTDPKEVELRSPGKWLDSIKTRTFVFEGDHDPSNVESLRKMAKASRNPRVSFHEVANADHFDLLTPLTKLVAKRIIEDRHPGEVRMEFKAEEMERLMR